MRLLLSVVLPLLASSAVAVHAEEKPRQLVIISFDGAHDNRLWVRSQKLSEKTGAKFTYFLSCTYLMSPDERHAYQGPHQQRGRSNTGFAQTKAEVRERLGHIWAAHLAGRTSARMPAAISTAATGRRRTGSRSSTISPRRC